MLFKFLNLVKFEEIYKSSKSWVDKFGMKLVSFARWTNFVHRGDNPPRGVHINPPSTVPPVDSGWVESTGYVNTPRWIFPPGGHPPGGIHRPFTYNPPSIGGLYVNTPILHRYFISILSPRWTVDGGRWIVCERSIN